MVHEQKKTISARSNAQELNTRSARGYSMFAPAQISRNCSERRPSNQGDTDSVVTEEAGKVCYTGVDHPVISFLNRSTWLFWGSLLNSAYCIV
jgi:hypothetical protein